MQTDVLHTKKDYLALEAASEDVKHEFDGDRVYAMAGASMDHNQLAINTSTTLNTRLAERRCRVFQSDMRVRISGAKYVYPDVVALCAEPAVTDEDPPSLLNPELVVEITSPSTSHRDRTWKLESYLQLESLQEYWILETDAPRVQQYLRNGDDWTLRTRSGLEATIESDAFKLKIALKDLYRLVIE